MATKRTLAALEALLADNATKDIEEQDLRDFLVSVYPVWEDYTPIFDSDGTPASIGNGSLAGRVCYLGEGTGALVLYTIKQVWGTTTSNGIGGFRWTTPIAHGGEHSHAAACKFFDASAAGSSGHRDGVAFPSGTGSKLYVAYDANLLQGSAPWTWVTGDIVLISGVMERP